MNQKKYFYTKTLLGKIFFPEVAGTIVALFCFLSLCMLYCELAVALKGELKLWGLFFFVGFLGYLKCFDKITDIESPKIFEKQTWQENQRVLNKFEKIFINERTLQN